MLRTPGALPTTRRQCSNGISTTEAAAEMSDLQSRYEELLAMVQNLQSIQKTTSVLKTDASPKTPPPVGRVGEVEGGEKDHQGVKVLQLDEVSGAIKGRRLFPPTDGSRSVIVASGNPSQTRESAAFAESVLATDGAPRCFRCDEEGHMIRDCPQKKKASVKFAAAVRARKSSSKRAVVSDDED